MPNDLGNIGDRQVSNIATRVAIGSGLLWGTATIVRIFQLGTIMVLARLLSPEDYGIVAVASTVVGLISVLLNIELSAAIVRSRELVKDHLDTAFTLSVLKGLAISSILVLLAWPTAWWTGDGRLFPVMLALAVPPLITSLQNPYFLLYARNLQFGLDARRQAAAAVAASAVGIAVAALLQSYWALVANTWATAVLTTLLSYWRVPGRPGWSFTRSRELLSFGGWITAIGILDAINTRVDYLLISRLSARELGAYHVGQQITTLVTGDITQTLGRTLLPAFSIMSDDSQRLRRNYREVQAMAMAAALPIGFGTAALADQIVSVVVGPQWGQAVLVITYLAPLIALQTAFAGVEALALSLNRGRMLFNRTLIFFGVRVTLMFIGFYYGGFMGIVYARVASGTFFLVYGLFMASSFVGSKIIDPFIASWRSIVAVSAMLGALYYLPEGDEGQFGYILQMSILLGEIAVGGATYISVHLMLWLIAGKPTGVESQILSHARFILAHIRTMFR